MENEKLLIKCDPKQGYNKIFDVGERKMELTRFGLLRLEAGGTFSGETGEFEMALVVLGGKCSALGDTFCFAEAGERPDVFSGKPYCIYLPRRTRYMISAITDLDIAVNEAPASRDTASPTLITPQMTRHLELGRDNWRRTSEIILDENFDSEHFYIGEGMIPSGNWSGYPPHRHDFDNPPDEIDMEETYFYRFAPSGGFGFQRVYQPDGTLEETYTVCDNDTVAIKEGFHPLCGAPGYSMYYLWTMAGKRNRGLISYKDPQHSWVR